MSNQGATLTACNGGASGLLKDIQRRLSTSGILPGLKPDPPAVVVPQSGNSNSPTQNKPYKLKNVSTGSESYDCLHYNRSKVRNHFFYLICIRCFFGRKAEIYTFSTCLEKELQLKRKFRHVKKNVREKRESIIFEF